MRSARFFSFALLAAAGTIAVTAFVSERARSPRPAEQGTSQCGHWCIYRSCQLLGAPVALATIREMLPAAQGGHTMLQLADTLSAIGFETEGREETLDALSEMKAVRIAHLRPDHFVVLLEVEGKSVHLFDAAGRRSTRPVEEFARQWSGHVLLVRRSTSRPLPAFTTRAAAGKPCIQFDQLLIDKGAVEYTGKPVSFRYRFRNLGSADLLITDVKTDCHCLEARRPTRAIAGGEEAAIDLSFHAENRVGAFSHQATVESNDPGFPIVSLWAAGSSSISVKTSPSRVDFGETVAGEKYSAAVFLRYTGDEESVSFDTLACSLSGGSVKVYRSTDPELDHKKWWPFQRPAKEKERDSRKCAIAEVMFAAPEDASGVLRGEIVVTTNISKAPKVTVPVTARVLRRDRVMPSALFATAGASSTVIEGSLALISAGSERVRLVRVVPNPAGLWCEVRSGASDGRGSTIRISMTEAAAAKLDGSELRLECQGVESRRSFSVLVPMHIWFPRGAG